MSSTNQQLQQAYELIKVRKKSEAVDLLVPILKTDEDNANAWWLMANALDTPDDIREALENVIRLRPENDKAREMLNKLNERFPPKPKIKNDEFTFDDDPFADIPAAHDDPFADDYDENYKPKVYQKGRGALSSSSPSVSRPRSVSVTKSKSSTNPLVIILAIIGVVALGGCLLCVATGTIGTIFAGQMVEQLMGDPTIQAAMDEFAEIAQDYETLRAENVTARGEILFGTTERATLDAFSDDSWMFNGRAGDTIIIEAVSPDGMLDPRLFFYNADGQLLAQNDDIDLGENTNARIQIALPYDGRYSIVVNGWFGSGFYELTIR